MTGKHIIKPSEARQKELSFKQKPFHVLVEMKTTGLFLDLSVWPGDGCGNKVTSSFGGMPIWLVDQDSLLIGVAFQNQQKSSSSEGFCGYIRWDEEINV